MLKQNSGIEFFYDAGGVAGLKYNGVTYFYRKDAQGNIIAILNASGEVVVKYFYDAWGNQKILYLNYRDSKRVYDDVSVSPYGAAYDYNRELGKLNPFRYRGYYYDTETGLYFLQTRYYDPEVGRFISQDSLEYADPETTNGLNLYAYCGNNPVMNVDPTGEFFITFLFVTLGIGLVAGATVGGISAAVNGENVWEGIWKGALVGLMIGGSVVAIGTGIVVFAAGSIGAAVSIGAGVGSLIAISMTLSEQLQNGGFGNLDMKTVGASWLVGFGIGALIGGMGYAGKTIGATIGQKLGLALAGKSFWGTTISRVFSKAFLAQTGNLLGGALGSYLGGKFVNELATNSGLQKQNIPVWVTTILKFFAGK